MSIVSNTVMSRSILKDTATSSSAKPFLYLSLLHHFTVVDSFSFVEKEFFKEIDPWISSL
jgi:hypothetical protein